MKISNWARNCFSPVTQRLSSWNWRLVGFMLLAQVMAVALFGTGVTSDILQQKHSLNLPGMLALFVYTVLLAVYMPLFLLKYQGFGVMRQRWWRYIPLAVCDFGGTYLIVSAYRYTNYLSIQLLDCLIIPFVMLLSIFFMRKRFLPFHYVGSLLSVTGAVGLVLADLNGDYTKLSKGNVALWDGIVVCGCFLYAVSNVLGEYLTRESSGVEWLAMLSLYAAPMALTLTLALEIEKIKEIVYAVNAIPLLLAYVICLLVFYSAVPSVLENIGASNFNLSIIITDVYSVTYFFSRGKKFTYYYGLAIAAAVLGNVVYNSQTLWAARKKSVRVSAGNSSQAAPEADNKT